MGSCVRQSNKTSFPKARAVLMPIRVCMGGLARGKKAQETQRTMGNKCLNMDYRTAGQSHLEALLFFYVFINDLQRLSTCQRNNRAVFRALNNAYDVFRFPTVL